MRLAAAVGVNTARTEVLPITDLDVPDHVKDSFDEFLLVERFDRFKRDDGSTGRIHFEELTQAIGLDARQKYRGLESAMVALLTILKHADRGSREDIEEFFRRWTVNALMGNTDAHSKNWGLIYRDGRNARLSPAYDLVCVASYFEGAATNEYALHRKMNESLRMWGEDRAEAMVKAAGLLQYNPIRRVVRETKKLAAKVWPQMLEEAPERVRNTISLRLKELVARPGAPTATARPGARP